MNIIKKICEKQNSPIGAAPITMAFFGDSVTQGCFELYKTSKDGFETEFYVEEGYHYKLRKLFGMCYPNVPINMIFAGISGDNVESGNKRLERDVLAYHPDITIVCFGLNDCGGGVEKLDVYRKNLDDVLRKLQESGSEVIFMTPNNMPDKLSAEISDEYMAEVIDGMIKTHGVALPAYIDTAREVCKNRGVPVCDCYAKWEKLRENGVNITRLLANRVNHPVPDMHWLFATSLFEMMMDM